ncbi:protein kinase [Actinosynnema pretiosum subsp. pretiosum]|uniref:non-specific serine/threonine protein kinase n=1 Tax=Actinosynnema pretiosum subsp. pretiosum TaxID=103721 RepID=A0AA45R715_9PSEU|nr:hypothetical protein APASM_0596 [Actinosynnema pretiosum subsp. pretiosum]QUF07622.1 protein kinase [Actinosynnema pretiosum subsp. pretiosum]
MDLAKSVLLWLHGWSVELCPGDWALTTTAFGALIGTLPTIASLLAIVIRRVVGNSYGPVTGGLFAVLGVTSTLVLPWVMFSATVKLLGNRALPGSGTLDDRPCGAFTQGEYLLDGPSIARSFTDGNLMYVIAGGTAAVLALLCLLFVMLQAGSTFRLGPSWPRKVFWVPFAVLLVATSALPVSLMAHLYAGFFPVALIGSIVVRIFGLTTAMLNRPGRDRGNSAPPQPQVSRPPAHQPPAERKKAALPPSASQSAQHSAQHSPPPYQPAGSESSGPHQKPPPYQPAPYAAVPQRQQSSTFPPQQSAQQSAAHQPSAHQSSPQARQYPPTRVADLGQVSGPNATRVGPPPFDHSGQGPAVPQGPNQTRMDVPQGAQGPNPTRVESLPLWATDEPTAVDQARLDGPARLADTPGPLPFGAGAASASMPAAPQKGKVWNPASGRFRRVKQLGSGGFGTVWLAVDTQLDRTVAVKLAHAPDNDTEQRMLREARALAALRHPNCVRVFDIVQDPDGLAIVMEYIDGQALSDVVQNDGFLTDVLAARLWINMADALAAAHEKGVLHRDVKPSNVIVDGEGTAHLIDFGIARSKGDSTLTATGMMVGTPDFLAPETARGDAATPASDAWQLAATVSYALTGQPPRGTRENPISSLMAAAQGEPCVKLPHQSTHLRLLTAALDADPARRPTLAAIRSELGAWLVRAGVSKEGPVTQMISKPDPPTRPVR